MDGCKDEHEEVSDNRYPVPTLGNPHTQIFNSLSRPSNGSNLTTPDKPQSCVCIPSIAPLPFIWSSSLSFQTACRGFPIALPEDGETLQAAIHPCTRPITNTLPALVSGEKSKYVSTACPITYRPSSMHRFDGMRALSALPAVRYRKPPPQEK
ncbi:hypothetical protein P154DRAFT_621735, partial [Amniculicola lignicola CBS 123094]